MIMRDQDINSSQEETTSSPSSSGSEDEVRDEESSEEVYPLEEGDLLMLKRLLGGQSCDLSQSQRENIFYTRCKILDKTCSLIVDSGPCCNCCSTILVSKKKEGDAHTVTSTLAWPKPPQTPHGTHNMHNITQVFRLAPGPLPI